MGAFIGCSIFFIALVAITAVYETFFLKEK